MAGCYRNNQELKHYFKANQIKDENKVSVLITIIGLKVHAVLSDLVSPDSVDAKSYDEFVKVLVKHYTPRNKALWDKLVVGIADDHMRQLLLSEDLSFEDVYELAIRLEQSDVQKNAWEFGHNIINGIVWLNVPHRRPGSGGDKTLECFR
ncbi:hypothetical protein PR048_019182 [Dryococelus australis]|uniref:Uncharacterized protein n=1 Tax=Dryococelus australis TaxID=614101 RepID=A0ABQ9H340_9NEOP|nr:hypothetical protein PR048_019182 [Dryococelus australis]